MTGWSCERGSEAEWERPIRALLLDVDDTLVDTQAAMRHSCRVGAVAAWPDEAPEVHTAISDVFYDDPGGHFNAYTRGEQAFDEMRHNRYARAVTGLGLRDVGFDVFEAAYLQEFGQAQHLFDDVMPMLAVARENEVAVVMVTNSSADQTRLKLERVGLAGVGEVVTTDLLGFGKPDPRVFEHACERAGVAPEEALVVGDTLPTDVEGGRRAGIRVAWLIRPGLPEPRGAGWDTPVPDPGVRVVGSLREVAALL